MYSACAHISGLAEPVGRPRNMKKSGRSGSSQTCSGSNPVGEANPSIARRYGSGGRPAANSYVPSLPGEQGPCAPLSVPGERAAVLSLPVPVVVVPPPARTVRRVYFEHGIQHAQGVHDDGIVRFPDPIPDKFQEPSVDDLLPRETSSGNPGAGWPTQGRRGWDPRAGTDRSRLLGGCGCNASVSRGRASPPWSPSMLRRGLRGSRRTLRGKRPMPRLPVRGRRRPRRRARRYLRRWSMGNSRRPLPTAPAVLPAHGGSGSEPPPSRSDRGRRSRDPPCAAGATPGGWGRRPRPAGPPASTARRRSRSSGKTRRPRAG